MLNTSLIAVALLLLGAATIEGGKPPSMPVPSIKGRLLTPQEGCGLSKLKAKKIIGGSYAVEGAWPWVAAIACFNPKNETTYKFRCGGSLITSRHVLTAAHCNQQSYPIVFVRLGAIDLTVTGDGPHKDIKVIHLANLPTFKMFSGTDLAMLYLEHDVEFTDLIRPICVPTEEPIRSLNFVGTNPFVAGWGRTVKHINQTSDFLKQLQVPVLNNSLCEWIYHEIAVPHVFLNDDVICAGDLNNSDGFASGDSGGPLMLPVLQNGLFSFYLIGVVSYGMTGPQKIPPDVYVNVSYHVDWIQEMVNKKIE